MVLNWNEIHIVWNILNRIEPTFYKEMWTISAPVSAKLFNYPCEMCVCGGDNSGLQVCDQVYRDPHPTHSSPALPSLSLPSSSGIDGLGCSAPSAPMTVCLRGRHRGLQLHRRQPGGRAVDLDVFEERRWKRGNYWMEKQERGKGELREKGLTGRERPSQTLTPEGSPLTLFTAFIKETPQSHPLEIFTVSR